MVVGILVFVVFAAGLGLGWLLTRPGAKQEAGPMEEALRGQKEADKREAETSPPGDYLRRSIDRLR